VSRAREISGNHDNNDAAFALRFYRYQRMPGNFSLRHAVLSSLRSKISPFLDNGFMDCTYNLEPEWYADSRLHRELIAHTRADLLHFFDAPVKATQTVQEWPFRFANGIGRETYRMLDELLLLCDDVFCAQGVLDLCRSTTERPTRALYHLFRILSFAVARRILRVEAKERLTAIPRMILVANESNLDVLVGARS
jgi:hypothetical protein